MLDDEVKNQIKETNDVDEILFYLEHYEDEKNLEQKKVKYNTDLRQDDKHNEYKSSIITFEKDKFCLSNQFSTNNKEIVQKTGNMSEEEQINKYDYLPIKHLDKITPFLAHHSNHNNDQISCDYEKKIGNRSSSPSISEHSKDNWSENSSIESDFNSENKIKNEDNPFYINEFSNEKLPKPDDNCSNLQIQNIDKQEEYTKYISSETCLKLGNILKKNYANKLSLSPRKRKFKTTIDYLPLIKDKSVKKEFAICTLIWITYGFYSSILSLTLRKEKIIYFLIYT